MEQVLTQLLDAVKSTLNGVSYSEKIEQEKAFYLMAKENGFSGMLYETLDMTQFTEKVKSRFTRDFFAYQAQDARQTVVINDVTELLNENEIKHIFLKGSQLKKLYPKPYMRQMGDVDILVESTSMKLIHKILTSNGYLNKLKSEQHDAFCHPNGTTLEIHPRLMRELEGNVRPLMNQEWHYASSFNQSTYILSPLYTCVYLLFHTAKHLYGSGIGLRTVLDIGIYLKAHKDEIDLNELLVLLEDNRLTQFFKTILMLNNRYFDIDIYPELLKVDPLDEKAFNILTNHIVISGIHGLGNEFNNYIGRVTTFKMQHKSKFLLLLKLIFPSYKAMRGMYHWLRPLPILLPLAWGLRIFKLIFKKTKRTFHRLKQLNINKETLDETVDMYKKIGL